MLLALPAARHKMSPAFWPHKEPINGGTMPRKKPDAATLAIELRFVVRTSEDGFVAECLDAGAVGIGATKADAIREMMVVLESLYAACGEQMKGKAIEEDEQLFARLEKGEPPGPADNDVVAWGRTERVSIIAAKGAAHEAFDVSALSTAA
jgi:hypothetical protein